MPAFFVTDAASAMEGEDDMRGAVGRQDVAMALLQVTPTLFLTLPQPQLQP